MFEDNSVGTAHPIQNAPLGCGDPADVSFRDRSTFKSSRLWAKGARGALAA